MYVGDETSVFEEAFERATEEMIAYFELTATESYYIRDNVQPIIGKALAKKEVRDKIIDLAGIFLDEHSYQLLTPGPMRMFVFGDKEVAPIYELLGISLQELLDHSEKMVQVAYLAEDKSSLNKAFKTIKKGPHKLLFTIMLTESTVKNYEDMIECCKYLLLFNEYPLALRHSWPIGVNEAVMAYTIEHLPNKFKIKKMKNLLELLLYDVNTAYKLCQNRLLTQVDNEYIQFIYRLRNQIKATFTNIANVYFDNVKENRTQHEQKVFLDDGELADNSDGYTANITQIIESTYTKIISNRINPTLLKISAEGNSINASTLSGYLNLIFTNKQNRIYSFIESVVISFASKTSGAGSPGSGEFITFGLSLYRSIASSKDPTYVKIRSIIDYWMNDIVHITDSYSNKGTIINYTRGIFNYMIMMINHHN